MTLYAVHVQGPDDIIAAPSKREAEVLAEKLMAATLEALQGRECYVSMEVIAWPGTAKEHAQQLAEDWAEHAKFIGPIDPEPERDTKTIDMFGES
jgi:precorrin-2 methylase